MPKHKGTWIKDFCNAKEITHKGVINTFQGQPLEDSKGRHEDINIRGSDLKSSLTSCDRSDSR